MNRQREPHLWVRSYFSQPAFEESQLDILEQLIRAQAPSWASGLRVSRDEPTESASPVRGSLFESVHEETPPRFGIGSTVISGTYGGVLFFLDSCRSTTPPELNMLSVEVLDRGEVEGIDPARWTISLLEALVQNLPTRYGSIRTAEEFSSKNVRQTKDGVEAVGVKLSKALPGLYWVNYFGAPYVDLMGRGRLLSTPSYEVQEVGSGVLIRLSQDPDEWRTPEYRERAGRIREHLGRQYFFDRERTTEPTRAPTFRKER